MGRPEIPRPLRGPDSAIPEGGFRCFHPANLTELAGLWPEIEAGHSAALLPAGRPSVADTRLPLSEAGPRLGVTSSGSTGQPRLVWRAWAELKAAASRSEAVQGWRWAAPYDPWSFAGVQVAIQAWVSGGAAVSLSGDWSSIWRRLEEEKIDALSCTPTFADLLIQNEPADGAAWQPRQLTLGGEPLRSKAGKRLRRRWPEARMMVIYAAAEFGVLMKTSRTDGWYEATELEARWPHWRIAAGTLELGRAARDGEADVTWVSTGDQVEQDGPLLRIIGRSDQVANVAGTKVSLAEVTALAEEVPGVRRARAVARSNPVTGQVVVLHYAVDEGVETRHVLSELEASLRSRLPKAAWPRDWVEEEVGLANNAKRAVA